MTTCDTRRPLRPLRFVIGVLVMANVVLACAPGGGAVATDIASGSAHASPNSTRSVEPPRATEGVDEGAAPTDPSPSDPSPEPPRTEWPATPPVATPDSEPFAMNLFRDGDHVAQYTFEWCVGASVQMALNLATDESHTTRAEQARIWEMARDQSFSPFGGANPRGWTAVLNDLGVGPYELVSLPTFDEALIVAAEAIRLTRRPVGLVMWRGRHAWVMSGFEATADPRAFDEFEVTGIRVLDPLYPHGSSVWGRSPKPNSLVSPETLGKQFVLRDSTRVDLGVPPGYLLVLPVAGEA